MKKSEKCPASKDITELERHIQYLEGITKDIEKSQRLPEKLKEMLSLCLTPICGYESRKYNSVAKQINDMQVSAFVAQSNITGVQKIVDNTEIMRRQYIKIIDGLVKYTKSRIKKLEKEAKTKEKQNPI